MQTNLKWNYQFNKKEFTTTAASILHCPEYILTAKLDTSPYWFIPWDSKMITFPLSSETYENWPKNTRQPKSPSRHWTRYKQTASSDTKKQEPYSSTGKLSKKNGYSPKQTKIPCNPKSSENPNCFSIYKTMKGQNMSKNTVPQNTLFESELFETEPQENPKKPKMPRTYLNCDIHAMNKRDFIAFCRKEYDRIHNREEPSRLPKEIKQLEHQFSDEAFKILKNKKKKANTGTYKTCPTTRKSNG